MMKAILFVSLCLLPFTALATEETSESTAKKADKSLSEGASKIKNIGADSEEKKKKRGDSTADKLNNAWDSMLGGIGGVLRSQNTDTNTATEKKTEKQ